MRPSAESLFRIKNVNKIRPFFTNLWVLRKTDRINLQKRDSLIWVNNYEDAETHSFISQLLLFAWKETNKLPGRESILIIGSSMNQDDDSNKNVKNVHIWRWKTILLHALHVKFSFLYISQTFSFFPRREWPVLQLCGRREHMTTKFNFVFLSLKHWFQFNSRIVRAWLHG